MCVCVCVYTRAHSILKCPLCFTCSPRGLYTYTVCFNIASVSPLAGIKKRNSPSLHGWNSRVGHNSCACKRLGIRVMILCIETAIASKYMQAIRHLPTYGKTTAERVIFVLTFLKIHSSPPPPHYHRRFRIT